MPIFIDELVIRGEVVPSVPAAAGGAQAGGNVGAGADRQALVAEVTETVIEHLERALERIGER